MNIEKIKAGLRVLIESAAARSVLDDALAYIEELEANAAASRRLREMVEEARDHDAQRIEELEQRSAPSAVHDAYVQMCALLYPHQRNGETEIDALRRLVSAAPAAEPAAWVSLTDDDRYQAFAALPDALEGFLKKWGWLHFAKEIERRCMEKNKAAPQPAQAEEEQ